MKNKHLCDFHIIFVIFLSLLAVLATINKGMSQNEETKDAAFVAKVCLRLEEEARRLNIPEAFFARLIWKESRFDPYAISPKGAEGIAQFMPTTARLRGLALPFDPNSAITASASYLSDLHNEFGNWGLAAAAYNAGAGR